MKPGCEGISPQAPYYCDAALDCRAGPKIGAEATPGPCLQRQSRAGEEVGNLVHERGAGLGQALRREALLAGPRGRAAPAPVPVAAPAMSMLLCPTMLLQNAGPAPGPNQSSVSVT